jgi:ribosomal protein L35
MTLKTKNIISKRIKRTKNSKIFHKACGQNHFNAKEPSRVTKNKRRNLEMSKSFKRTILRSI